MSDRTFLIVFCGLLVAIGILGGWESLLGVLIGVPLCLFILEPALRAYERRSR